MFRAGLVHVPAGRVGALGVVLDEFDPGAVEDEVGEPASRAVDSDAVGERLATDGESLGRGEVERVPVELDRTVEVGHGHAEVVWGESGHVTPADGRRQSHFGPTGRTLTTLPPDVRGMTFVVPFDGSELAETALVRAVEFGTVLDERIVAVSVIPADNASYARENDWLDPEESFDLDTAVARLHEDVAAHAPSAEFRYDVVGRRATPGTIASRIREAARDVNASMVFVGSENAGRLVSSLSSVGDTVAADDAYDVVIVRHREPSKIEQVNDASPFRESKSDFYR